MDINADLIVYVLFGIGLFTNSMSIVGLMRFPDVYTRLHAATKTTTFGSIFIVGGVVVYNMIHFGPESLTVILHSLAALIVIIFSNPVSAHAIARASMLSGIKPYGASVDAFSERFRKTGSGAEKRYTEQIK